jgi:ribosomal protein L7/L12
MDLSFWQWVAVPLAIVLIFKAGVAWGRLSADSEHIQPISTTRISPEARARIDDALRRGNKIEAIKILREDAGCGLAEAKKTVEALRPPTLG